jgi:hypothetical protein
MSLDLDSECWLSMHVQRAYLSLTVFRIFKFAFWLEDYICILIADFETNKNYTFTLTNQTQFEEQRIIQIDGQKLLEQTETIQHQIENK